MIDCKYMSDQTSIQYQELMKPFFDLIKGIVHIVEYESEKQEKEVSDDLINQIFLSVSIMHLSDQSKGKTSADSKDIEDLVESGKTDEVLKIFSQGISKENFLKYLEDSSTVVMTNYYYKVKEKMTPEKTKKVENLYNNISKKL